MPLYEYRCQSCGKRFEVLQRMGAQPDGLACPECGAEGSEKVFSTFAGGASRSNSAQPAGSCGSGRFT